MDIGKLRLMRQTKTRQPSYPIVISITSYACSLDCAKHQEHSNILRTWPVHSQMSARPRLPRQYCFIYHNAAATHQSCSHSPFFIIQRRRHTRKREVQIHCGHPQLLGSRNLPKAFGTRFSHNGRNPWTPTIDQRSRTTTMHWFMQHLPTIGS